MTSKIVNNIDDAILKVIGSATDSKFVIKNNKDILNKVNTIQDNKFQSFVSNTLTLNKGSHWNKIDKVRILRLEGDRGGTIRKVVKNKLPYKDYSVMKGKTNQLAMRAGFKNEEEFIKSIDDYLILYKTDKTVLQNPKLLQMFQFLKHQAIKNPKTTLVAILASGSIIAILKTISEIHRKNTGCFRYYKDENNNNKLIKQKILGNFCVNGDDDDNDLSSGDDHYFLPESEHPLFNKEKWDCNYKNFDLNGINGIKATPIFDLGCNGLCDLLNYNALAALTPEYEGITLSDEEHEKHDKYMYVCERASILRELTTDILDSVNEVAQGVMQSQIGYKIQEYFHIFKSYIVYLILIIFAMVIVSYKMKNNNNNNNINNHQNLTVS